jgi:hypothetical protein
MTDHPCLNIGQLALHFVNARGLPGAPQHAAASPGQPLHAALSNSLAGHGGACATSLTEHRPGLPDAGVSVHVDCAGNRPHPTTPRASWTILVPGPVMS